MPTEIWGVKGESSSGAGTGGPTGPVPTGEADGCDEPNPDAPPTDNRTLWSAVKTCGGATPSTEWVPIDSETYPEGSVYRVDDLPGGDESGEQCVVVSTDRSLSELVPDNEFPTGASIICSGYEDCDECNAPCYKLTDCLTAGVSYTKTDLSAYVDSVTVVAGRCYTVTLETDHSNCCPGDVSDVSAAGAYSSCEECHDAISPSPSPCECPYSAGGDTGPSTVTLEVTAKIYDCSDPDWVLNCTATGSVTLTQDGSGSCSWINNADTIACGGGHNLNTFALSLDTDGCYWLLDIGTTAGGATSRQVRKTVGQNPLGSYTGYDIGFGLGCPACDPPDSADCFSGGPLSTATIITAVIS